MNDVPISDYFLIGDCYSTAHISNQGSIDWLCLPYFDSPSVFGHLLDPGAGNFSLDVGDYTLTSAYVPDSAIVEHTLSQSGSRLRIHDFMVPNDSRETDHAQFLVRSVTALEGNGQVGFRFDPRPGYAMTKRVVIVETPDGLELQDGTAKLLLHFPENTTCHQETDGAYVIKLSIVAGSEASLILEYAPSGKSSLEQMPDPGSVTRAFWQDWVRRGTFVDFCRERLVRSAITLKLLQFAPTGALVAAPTTSLPEHSGGVRNWDYRYVWIRDATFTLFAFYVLGYTEEARRFFEFIFKVLEEGSGQAFDVSLMYTIFGKPVPKERVLGHFHGYQNSTPVRIGNEAAEQLQLDVYGALIDAYYFATKKGFSDFQKSRSRDLIMNLVKKIEQLWDQPDSGIWEARLDRRHYTYSKVMCWVGADRAYKLKDTLALSSTDARLCEQLAGTISNYIWQHSYDAESVIQYPGAETVDATNFLFVVLQFLDKHETRTAAIIQKTRDALAHNEVFVYRYLGDDGLPGKEGAFLLCSFWLISAFAILEDVETAKNLFEKLEARLSLSGLIAEEIDPDSGVYLGNYPQAFSHLGYIMSAHYLDKYSRRAAGEKA